MADRGILVPRDYAEREAEANAWRERYVTFVVTLKAGDVYALYEGGGLLPADRSTTLYTHRSGNVVVTEPAAAIQAKLRAVGAPGVEEKC